MALKTYEELQRDLKNKIYSPIYFLQGEEAYYIDQIAEIIEKEVLGEMEKEFNQTVVYGRECEALSLISTAKRYPMMSNYQVVIVKEAQDMKTLLGKKDEKDDKDPLLNYVSNPLPSTLLVFCCKYKTLDKRTKFYKAIEKHGVVFESKKIYENKVPEWIEKYLAKKDFKIKPRASQLMADHLGNDLSRVANECDKLLINVKKGETIDVHNIETNIGISKEFNIFELQKALGSRNVLQANRIVNYFKANPKNSPIQVTMANFYLYFSKVLLYHSLPDKSKLTVAAALKVNPYFVEDYMEAGKNFNLPKVSSILTQLREYDLKSKGVNNISTNEGELLRELVYKILH
ncbi:DNA polymerase III subunit delta [soil metagenome]